MSEQKKAANAYKAGAAQRDPAKVADANRTASQNGSNSAAAARGQR
ncbi:hypothetical protein ABZ593_21115 [Streptomyces sp. NPDC012617]